MADGADPVEGGRLDVDVVADLTGFAAKLRAGVEKAAKGVEAGVQVAVDSTGLREKLQAAVDTAAAGVKATIPVEIDRKTLRDQVENAAAAVADGINVPVGGKGQVADDTTAEAAAGQAIADRAPVEVPVKTKGSLVDDLLRQIAAAKATANANPIGVRLTGGGGRGARTALRVAVFGGIASLIQPLIATIGVGLAGLTAATGAAAPATGVIGALPGLVGSLVQGIVAGTIALSGFGDGLEAVAQLQAAANGEIELSDEQIAELNKTLDRFSPSAVSFMRKLFDLRGEWGALRKAVQEPLFKALDEEIKPLARVALPILQDGLAGTTQVLGDMVRELSEWIRSPAWRRDTPVAMRIFNDLIAAGGDLLLSMVKATLDFVVASGPFLERVGDGARAFGEWLENVTKVGRESRDIERFLERAADKAGQLGRIVRDLAGGLFGIFSGGVPAGETILDRMEQSLARFNEWANSSEGQRAIGEFFDDALPGFFALVNLIGKVGKALGRLTTDPNVAPLLDMIAEELVPALESLLTTLAENLAPKVINFLTDLAELLERLGGASGPLGLVVDVLDGLVEALTWFVDNVPGADTALGILLGSLLAFRILGPILRPISKLLKGIFGKNGIFGAGGIFGSGGGKHAKTGGIGKFLAGLFGGKSLEKLLPKLGKALKFTSITGLVGAIVSGFVGDGEGGIRDIIAGAITGAATGGGVGSVGGPIGAAIGGLVGAIVGGITSAGAWDDLGTFFVDLGGNIVDWIGEGLAPIGEFFGGVFDDIGRITSDGWTGISEIFGFFWDIVGPIVRTGWEILSGFFRIGFTVLSGIAGIGWELIKTPFEVFWALVGPALEEGWKWFKGLVSEAMGNAKENISNRWEAIKQIFDAVWGKIGPPLEEAWENVKSTIGGAMLAAEYWVGRGVDFIDGKIEELQELPGKVRGWFEDIREGIETKLDEAQKAVEGLDDKILEVFANADDWLWEAGRSIINGLIDGIQSKLEGYGSLASTMGTVASTVLQYLPLSPAKRGPLRRHPPDASGATIVSMLASGIRRNIGKVMAATELAAAAVSTGLYMSNGAAALHSRRPMARLIPSAAAAGGGGGVPVQVDVHPREGQSEYEIGQHAANAIEWHRPPSGDEPAL